MFIFCFHIIIYIVYFCIAELQLVICPGNADCKSGCLYLRENSSISGSQFQYNVRYPTIQDDQ